MTEADAPRGIGAGSIPGSIVPAVLDWYRTHARDLPWRAPGISPWAVLVSEFMLQQTPVARVLPVWRAWMARWPTPADLAAEPVGEAIAAWGRLGYPRRALRLHGAAVAILDRHGGQVPCDPDDLQALPGVGQYTAAAVASFAFARPVPVLDTNVRRVLGRILDGQAHPAAHITAAELTRAAALLPADGRDAAAWNVAAMELGAVVCTARVAHCEICPVRRDCRWQAAGRPAAHGPVRRGQAWHGTDRQCRGVLLRAVREAHPAQVGDRELLASWADADQARRARDSLLADGLLSTDAAGSAYRLPD